MTDTEQPIDTHVAWIDRITPDERKRYHERCAEIHACYPALDGITLSILAKRTEEELEEIFGKVDEDWKPEPPKQPEEKCVMCFNSREEMEEYNKKHK